MSAVLVGLARARYGCNFVTAAETAGAPVRKILDKAGLNESIFEHPEAMTTAW